MRLYFYVISILSIITSLKAEPIYVYQRLNTISKIIDTSSFTKSSIKKELDELIESSKVDDSDDTLIAKAYFLRALCFSIDLDYGNSLIYFKSSKDLYLRAGESLKIVNVNFNIGILYLNIENYNSAIEYFKLVDSSYTNNLKTKFYYLWGYCLNKQGKFLEAKSKLYKALQYAKPQDKRRYEIKTALIDIAIFEKKWQSALFLINDCKPYFIRTENQVGFFLLKLKQARIEHGNNHNETAFKLAKIAYDGLRKLNYQTFIAEASNDLSIYAELTGKYRDALYYERIYRTVKDSIANENNRWALNMMQADLVLTEKENKIKVLEKEKIIERDKLLYQQVLSIGALVGLLIVAVLLFFTVRNFRITKKQNNIILLQKDKLETQVDLVNNKNQEILASINYASRLQSAIVNPKQYFSSIFPESFIYYLPKDIVAGDFYWCEKIDNKIFFAAADCTGHGVPGALVSVVCATALNRTLYEYEKYEPGEILDTTRQLIIETFSKSKSGVMDGMDISFCVLDTNTNILKWAGANNPLWIYKKENQQLFEYKPNKQPIGNWENATPFVSHSIQLLTGDILYLFTDGYQDQFGSASAHQPIKKFKPAGMRNLFTSIANQPAHQQLEVVRNTFDNWRGESEQIDDVTVIGIRI